MTELDLKTKAPNDAKPVLWDSFKNLLGWAIKQQNTNENELQKN